MRRSNNAVDGAVVMKTGDVYSSPNFSIETRVGSFTYQQSYILSGTETRTIYNCWIAFTDATQSIHLEWYSIEQSGAGLGVILGGSGYYVKATGPATITRTDPGAIRVVLQITV